MKKYRIGDILIRKDGGIRVITGEKDWIFFLSTICADGTVNLLPHFKNMVYSKLYKKLKV